MLAVMLQRQQRCREYDGSGRNQLTQTPAMSKAAALFVLLSRLHHLKHLRQ
jgi:hypothetical protein